MEPGARPRYVVILPITHTPPDKDVVAIEIPANVRRAIGLDDAPSWIVLSEHNVDEWPNAGLAPLPGKPGVFGYGFIIPGLFTQVKARFLALSEAGGGAGVERSGGLYCDPLHRVPAGLIFSSRLAACAGPTTVRLVPTQSGLS